jgi:hypothetical protein
MLTNNRKYYFTKHICHSLRKCRVVPYGKQGQTQLGKALFGLKAKLYELVITTCHIMCGHSVNNIIAI